MGRKKTYDRDTLITRSMEMFRDHGFAGTSTQMLVEGLGVNRYSLYAEFGSKQALFDAALQRYDETVIGPVFEPLETSGAGVAEVRAVLEHFGRASDGPAAGRGCLLCNTAVEFGATDLTGARFVERYFDRLSSAFTNALTRAQDAGQLRASVDPAREASFLTASMLGLFVMLRAEASPSMIQDATRVALDHLDTSLA